MTRVPIHPKMLRWACERAGLDPHELGERIPQFDRWARGEQQPTLKQLERFARATRTPIGYLFLEEPPEEPVPIPDFRTMADGGVARPSPDLLDTVYLCQQRQEWYREYAMGEGASALPFAGSVKAGDDPVATAGAIRSTLGFDVAARRGMATWTDALRLFLGQADEVGILTMVSGVVGSNTHRTLDPCEFRGFALADPITPLVFINGADSKSAQMFTLAHELVHVWLGQSALSDADASGPTGVTTERWCNEVAAELLVPLATFRAEIRTPFDLREEVDRLARVFKVSTLVVLRRMRDAVVLGSDTYWTAYREEVDRLRAVAKDSGGDFYRTLGTRVSRRFAHAVVVSTLESRSTFSEAFRLLGFRSLATFQRLSVQLGVEA